MKHLKFLFVIILAVTFLTIGFNLNDLFASDHLSTIKQKGTLIVGTAADYPPYESVDNSGKFVGFDIDIVNEIAKRMGVKLEIKDLAFDTLIVSLQEKKLDLVVAAVTYTPERDKKVDFSIPYAFIKDAFLVNTKSGIKINKPTDVGGKKIGALTGTTHETWAKENLVEPGLTNKDQLFLYDRMDNAVLDLAAGRLDVILMLNKAANDMAAKMNNLKVAYVLNRPPERSGLCILLPEGEAALKAEVDKILTELKNDGWLDKKVAEYGL
jgi:polar amino acid transport system substrate-binding protein